MKIIETSRQFTAAETWKMTRDAAIQKMSDIEGQTFKPVEYCVYEDTNGVVSSGNLPDIKGRLVTFTKPTVVSEDFYKLFIAVTDTSEDIFGEGYDKAFGEVEYLNTELATSLYGGDTGYRGYYDEFWDAYQDNGNRGNYEFAFSGKGWTDSAFKPKYDITLNTTYSGTHTFHNSEITDLCSLLDKQGVTINTSGSKSFGQFAQNSKITKFPTIDFRKASDSTNYAFASTSLKSIEKLMVSDLTIWGAQTFSNATNLENVIFEGEIAKSGLNLQWSNKLSKASITSIINCLSTTTSGLTVTLSKTAVESAFGSTTSAEWTSLIGTRSNWTISLV